MSERRPVRMPASGNDLEAERKALENLAPVVPDRYRPEPNVRLQQGSPSAGTLWVGQLPTGASQANGVVPDEATIWLVWRSCENFRRYVNKLLDVYGHLTYAQLCRKAGGLPPGHDEADPSYD